MRAKKSHDSAIEYYEEAIRAEKDRNYQAASIAIETALQNYENVVSLDPSLLNNDNNRFKTILDDSERIQNTWKIKKQEEQVNAWIDSALAIAKDKKKCDTMVEVQAACEDLKKIPRSDRKFKKAVSVAMRLNKCREKSLIYLRKGLQDFMIQQREQNATNVEKTFLMQGFDVHVSLTGRKKDGLKLKYALFNRAWAYKMTGGGDASEGTFLGGMQKIGFKEVIFTDGWRDSFTWNLNPPNEKEAFEKSFSDYKPCNL